MFFYFTSLLTLSSGLNEIGFIKWVAEGYAKPLASVSPTVGMILLVSFFFWIHYFFSSITSHAAAVLPVVLAVGTSIPGLSVPTLTLLVRLFAGSDGRDLALCHRTRADVFRQRLYRQARFLEIWPDLRRDLFRRACS